MREFAEEKIVFADREEALAVLGKNDEHIRMIVRMFDCQISSRGDEVLLAGEKSEVQSAQTVFAALVRMSRQGNSITPQEVRYSIELIRKGKNEQLDDLLGSAVLVTSRGRPVMAKTLGQKNYLEAIRRNVITFGIGPAGTGKTYLAVVMAVAALRSHEVDRLILTRPAVEAGERLGFLPGDMQEKVDPYLRPLYDALCDILGTELYQKFMLKGIIEIAPLAYMRGRTLDNAFIILDEAQNTTDKQMKMFLTRLGFNSKMVITGDLSQVDLPRGVISGLAEAREVFADVEQIACIELRDSDVVRHEVVTRILRAYDSYYAAHNR